ncbi:Lztr1 [Symbiodinium sp. CCMP2592]|nr:Lztr1 [Symbiodinium sp. CCMP2592]
MALGRWSRLADLTDAGLVRPAARSEHVGAWDEARQVLLIHGGSNLEGDLWAFDATSDSWTRTVTAEAPAARTLHAAGWDSANQALWVHGGHNSQTATWFRDVWRFRSGIWVQVSNDAGPAGRQGHVAVWVPGTFSLWVHGGWTGTSRLSDLWSYSDQGHGWWELAPSGAPPARSHHVAAWDGVGQALWIHGGFGDSLLLGDLWTLDASTGSWREISFDAGPSARSGHTAVWDDQSRMLWLHGGNDGFPKQDLWRYESEQNIWSLISAEHAGPSGRWSHVAAWDSGNQIIYIHGGYNGTLCGDLWSFSVTTTSTTQTTSSSTKSSSQTSSSSSTSHTSSSSTSSSTTSTTGTSSTSTSTTSSLSSSSSTTRTQTSSTSSTQTRTSSTSTTATTTTTTTDVIVASPWPSWMLLANITLVLAAFGAICSFSVLEAVNVSLSRTPTLLEMQPQLPMSKMRKQQIRQAPEFSLLTPSNVSPHAPLVVLVDFHGTSPITPRMKLVPKSLADMKMPAKVLRRQPGVPQQSPPTLPDPHLPSWSTEPSSRSMPDSLSWYGEPQGRIPHAHLPEAPPRPSISIGELPPRLPGQLVPKGEAQPSQRGRPLEIECRLVLAKPLVTVAKSPALALPTAAIRHPPLSESPPSSLPPPPSWPQPQQPSSESTPDSLSKMQSWQSCMSRVLSPAPASASNLELRVQLVPESQAWKATGACGRGEAYCTHSAQPYSLTFEHCELGTLTPPPPTPPRQSASALATASHVALVPESSQRWSPTASPHEEALRLSEELGTLLPLPTEPPRPRCSQRQTRDHRFTTLEACCLSRDLPAESSKKRGQSSPPESVDASTDVEGNASIRRKTCLEVHLVYNRPLVPRLEMPGRKEMPSVFWV